ncbi:protein-tyrosine phosphatase-like protein [Syncephalis plumigaleata]|nr:protein-tyrosine phosphatase-like protein [Syncephalis plumigaleata]
MPESVASTTTHGNAHAAFAAAIAANATRGIQLPSRLSMVPPKSMPNLAGINRSLSLTSRPNGTNPMNGGGSGHSKGASFNGTTSTFSCKAYDCDSLISLLKSASTTGSGPTVLLLDVRPMPQQRAHGRIRNAVPVCISSTLLKRASFNVDRVGDLLASEEDRCRLLNWRQYRYVIVYDACATVLTEQGPVASLCHKFNREQTTGPQPHQSVNPDGDGDGDDDDDNDKRQHHTTIGWLKGGFDSLATKYTDWIEDAAEDVTPCELPSATQRNAQQAAAALASSGPLTCPTPMLENTPFFSSLMDSVCQGRTYYRDCPKDKHRIRLPSGYHTANGSVQETSTLLSALPFWLRQAILASDHLSKQFETIETEEQDRLRRLLIRHSRNLPATTATCPVDQYSIQAGLQHPCSNRYSNIWPYDRNRVCLATAASGENDLDSDYINASHVSAAIQVPEAPAYIVCQGPIPVTFAAFWWMCWAQGTQVIVMLTQQMEHGRVKCHIYWPATIGETISYGTITVQLVEEIPLPNGLPGVRRCILLKRPSTGETRTLYQVQYTGWPDHGVPEDPGSVIRLRQYVKQLRESSVQSTTTTTTLSPLVVHCSAGCGRSGVFCVLDTMLAEKERQLRLQQQSSSTAATTTNGNSNTSLLFGDQDMVQRLVSLFRTQRVDMVQTFGQYLLCYEALAWHFLGQDGCQ